MPPAAALEGAAFACVLITDAGLLPAVARLEPEQAAAFAALEGASATEANELCARLRESGVGTYLLKAGAVGGEVGQPGAAEVTAAHARAIVASIAQGVGTWERDPDFGYELATALPGVDPNEEGILVPRFHYTRTDRVYEHAAEVPRARHAWRARLAAQPDLDEAIRGALA